MDKCKKLIINAIVTYAKARGVSGFNQRRCRKSLHHQALFNFPQRRPSGIVATYEPQDDFDEGEPCPLCEDKGYYHVSMFSPRYEEAVARTICADCFGKIDEKVKNSLDGELKAIEAYSRQRFGNEIFDENIIEADE